MHIKDMLGATCNYQKNDLAKMRDDIGEFLQTKRGKIVKFVTMS